MHPEIAQLFAGAARRSHADGVASPGLRIVEAPPPEDPPIPQPDPRGEARRLQLVEIDARRHLVLVLDSHRRRADALAAINRDEGDERFDVQERAPQIP
jgi:hypothetical protein